MDDLALRPTTEADLLVIAGWILDADACRLWAGPQVRYPFTAEMLAHDIELAAGCTFSLVDEAGTLLGMGQIVDKGQGRRRRRCHLARIIVAPRMRGRGRGAVLCRKLIQEAIERFGAQELSLNVYASNERAVRLYRSLGFEVREAAELSLAGHDVLHMVLDAHRLR